LELDLLARGFINDIFISSPFLCYPIKAPLLSPPRNTQYAIRYTLYKIRATLQIEINQHRQKETDHEPPIAPVQKSGGGTSEFFILRAIGNIQCAGLVNPVHQ
jgi:hypothetical protein